MLGLGSSASTPDYVPINLADDISDMKRWYRPHEGVTFDTPTLKLEGWVDQTGNYNATAYRINSGIQPILQGDGSFLIHDEFAAALRVADKRITEMTIDAVFKSWSSRAVVSDTKTKVVRLDDFVKSCIANGLEQFSLLFERGPDAAAQRKKYAPSVYGSTST